MTGAGTCTTLSRGVTGWVIKTPSITCVVKRLLRFLNWVLYLTDTALSLVLTHSFLVRELRSAVFPH